jgi:hypothetical protein
MWLIEVLVMLGCTVYAISVRNYCKEVTRMYGESQTYYDHFDSRIKYLEVDKIPYLESEMQKLYLHNENYYKHINTLINN